MRSARAILTAGLLAVAATPAAARTWRVGPSGPWTTIGAALERAAPGDTIRVAAGVYRERLVVRRAVVLLGEGWPVIDGGGAGHVIEALAPIELRGFVVRDSGSRVDDEDAGLMVRGGTARVVGNRFEDVFFGVYLKKAPDSVVADNEIRGKPFVPPRRGDGIRLWYSPGTTIEANRVVGARDLVVWFSDGLVLRGNEVVGGRYGLHYMYSNHCRIEGNRLVGNEVGAFLMYSRGLELVDNRIEGSGDMGMGLKDADEITAVGNLFVENAVGLHLDNSPHSVGVENRLADNVFARNGAAVRLLPSVAGNRFSGNDFLDNDRPVEVAGGARTGQAEQNDWAGNHWSDYAGFDTDGDGRGDSPFVYARLADDLMSRHPALRLFAESPAFGALDLVARFFPLLAPQPVVVDSAPRLAAAATERWAAAAPARRGSTAGRAGAGAVWALAAVVAAAALHRAGRSR